ncbi:MAG: (p)ppGpp synthetase [Alkaliphilus sp.]|nr:MAG: (p)ppGpp synthetase [Alkaliphilus sp.]
MLENLIAMIEEYNPQCDVELIIKAYNFAESAHVGQYRKSGEKYFIHPVEVAKILIELKLDSITIAAALLHDILEDTDYSYKKLEEEFGKETVELVEGVTKLTRFSFQSKEEHQAENLRKMFVAMAKDIRIILIKLADRLHNMRTLQYQSEEKKKEKAIETLEIYAPIAHRLGISTMKWELEDICLKYIDPKAYLELVEKVAFKKKERDKYINEVIEIISSKIEDFNLKGTIYGRSKHFYSIYRKMKYRGKEFDEILDFFAVRVIVDSIKECYGVLGIVHTLWKPIPGRFKDYIAMPKPNMYQSIHTTVIGPNGDPVEIQIRTKEMHQIAEYGIAAHWKYKEGSTSSSEDELNNKLTWLAQMRELGEESDDPREFMESLKVDLLTNEVYVFTPKGEVINLPTGSTPIDFAYKIHSAVGNKCVGAKIDGRIVPLTYKLKNGNIVRILTSANSNGPSRDWLKIVKSSQAKNKIKQFFKKERREENVEKGQEILDREIKRQGLHMNEKQKSKVLATIGKRHGLTTEQDLYAAIGYGGIALTQVMPKINEFVKKEMPKKDHIIELQGATKQEKIQSETVKKDKSKQKEFIKVKGIDNIMVRFSKCCNPVPGDKISGFITRGRGVSIHRDDCLNIIENDDVIDRLIEVEWVIGEEISLQAEIQILAEDKNGLLVDITKILTELKIEMLSIYARTNKNKEAILNLVVKIDNVKKLEKLMQKIKNIKEVLDVKRVTT